jgi:hypothetical protein
MEPNELVITMSSSALDSTYGKEMRVLPVAEVPKHLGVSEYSQNDQPIPPLSQRGGDPKVGDGASEMSRKSTGLLT